MKLVAFNGSFGSGKSTAIEILKEISNNQVVNVKLAQPLYDIQEFIYNRIEPVHKRSEFFKKDRWLLQSIGQGFRDRISDSIWVDLWKAEIEKQRQLPNVVLTCDDVRYPNEVDVVRALGGHVVEIVAPFRAETTHGGTTNHASEQKLPSHLVDFTIKNDSTLEVYRNRLIDLFVNELEVETK